MRPRTAHRRPLAPVTCLALLAGAAALLAGCKQVPVTPDVPPPVFYQAGLAPEAVYVETVLDWPGTYQAVVPCRSCPGVAISVQLRAGKTALIRERYIGQANARPLQTYSGSFYFDPVNPGMIVMGQPGRPEAAARFFLSENYLELRDPVTGAPMANSAQYRLQKTSVMPESSNLPVIAPPTHAVPTNP